MSAGEFGFAVAGMGDINSDGVSEILVGAPFETPPSSLTDVGRAYVL